MTKSNDDYNYHIKALEQSKIVTIVIGTICTIFPLSVVFILLYRYDKLVKGKRLIHYILAIAISDTISSFCISLGYPLSTSSTCPAQAFLVIFFSRISWFYTDVLVFELFYLIVYKKHYLKIRYHHMIVWSLNILLQFLIYSEGNIYGNDDAQSGFIRCGISNGTGTPLKAAYWMFYTFQLELIISFILIAIFSVITISYCYYMSKKDVANMYMLPKIRSTWSTLILYPLGMLIAWVPYSLYAYHFNLYVVNNHYPPDNGLVVSDYFHLSNALYGVCLSFIFYTKTGDAIIEWKIIFNNLFNSLYGIKRIKSIDINRNENNDRDSRLSSISFCERTTVNVTKISNQKSNNNSVSNPIINIA